MTGMSAQFLSEYAQHRADEGRRLNGAELRALPYLRSGPLRKQWEVRARTFDAFVARVLEPEARQKGPLDVLDLGAGNGWLCHRLARLGHRPTALDIRDDMVDGLGAAAALLVGQPELFARVSGSFDELPFEDDRFDIVLFNASLHYACDLWRVLGEAARVARSGALIAVLDSPFYARAHDGSAMVAEKRAQGRARFGERANILLSQNFIEYLTAERLAAASPSLAWSRKRVRYPLWYELRPLLARLKRSRRPSRFDIWTARVP